MRFKFIFFNLFVLVLLFIGSVFCFGDKTSPVLNMTYAEEVIPDFTASILCDDLSVSFGTNVDLQVSASLNADLYNFYYEWHKSADDVLWTQTNHTNSLLSLTNPNQSGYYKVEVTAKLKSDESITKEVVADSVLVSIAKAQLTVHARTDYAFGLGELFLAQYYNSNSAFNGTLSALTHYFIECDNINAPKPSLGYRGVFNSANIDANKITVTFQLSVDDSLKYQFTNNGNIIELNGEINPLKVSIVSAGLSQKISKIYDGTRDVEAGDITSSHIVKSSTLLVEGSTFEISTSIYNNANTTASSVRVTFNLLSTNFVWLDNLNYIDLNAEILPREVEMLKTSTIPTIVKSYDGNKNIEEGDLTTEHYAISDSFAQSYVELSTKEYNNYLVAQATSVEVVFALTNNNFVWKEGKNKLNFTASITKANVTLSVNDNYGVLGDEKLSKTYDGNVNYLGDFERPTHYSVVSSGASPVFTSITKVFNDANVENANNVTATFVLADVDNFMFYNNINQLQFNAEIQCMPVMVTLSKDNYGYVYGESVDEPNATTNPNNIVLIYTYSSANYSASSTPPIIPGTYTVRASVGGNYVGSDDATYVIEKITPNLEGLSLIDKSVAYNRLKSQTISVVGTVPSYIYVNYKYQQKINGDWGEYFVYAPQNPGEYKVTATFVINNKIYYKDIIGPNTLEAILIILQTKLSTDETLGEHELSAEMETTGGVEQGSKLIVKTIDSSDNITSIPSGFKVVQYFNASLFVNNVQSTPTGQTIITVTLPDHMTSAIGYKLLVCENGEIVQRSFLSMVSNEISFYCNDLGDFVLIKSLTSFWVIFGFSAAIVLVLIVMIITIIREKKKEGSD